MHPNGVPCSPSPGGSCDVLIIACAFAALVTALHLILSSAELSALSYRICPALLPFTMSSKCLLCDSVLKWKVIAHEESPRSTGVVLRFAICKVNICCRRNSMGFCFFSAKQQTSAL